MSAFAMSPTAEAIRFRLMSVMTADEITALTKDLWQSFDAGQISEAESEALDAAIALRRPILGPAKGMRPRILSMFKPRQRPRWPDRKASRDRRRMLGGGGNMPPALPMLFTEGQRAVLAILSGEVKHHGQCDLALDRLAALAGVCRTTVQTTLHEARRRGLISIKSRPQRGRRSLTNIVSILSSEWLTWLKRGPSAHRPIGSKTLKMVSSTKSREERKSFGKEVYSVHPIFRDEVRKRRGVSQGVD
ncbi:MAG: hypothetical protein K0R27_3236 [Xanthobacteraceae bacterium]|jgi:hypothetical protein|nr:hypothetical protein [Xanthobacteraceae bacterium]